jgi:hypothetical protein
MVMLFFGMRREAGIEVSDPARKRTMTSPQKHTQKRNQAKEIDPVSSRGAARGDLAKSKGHVGATDTNQVFGITNDDIADLEDDEFAVIWEALGKLTRKRARRSKQETEAKTNEIGAEIDKRAEAEKS